jgi:NDP-sugar pyrophosphorylase family protein
MSGAAIRQAVILAGGKGTRLGAITQNIPKPMLGIAGDRPFLDYLIEMIERHGYRDIVLLAGHLGEALEAAYDGRRIGEATIRVVREKVALGTAGALTIAQDALDPRFLLMNGDAFFDINLRALEQASRQSGATATLALRSASDAARYGRVIAETDVIDKCLFDRSELFFSRARVTARRRAGREAKALPRSLHRRTSFAASVRARLGPRGFQPATKRA